MGQLYVKMATDLKLHRYSPRTQKSYLWAAHLFVRHFMRAMGSAEIRQFLLMLHERGESASSIKMCSPEATLTGRCPSGDDVVIFLVGRPQDVS